MATTPRIALTALVLALGVPLVIAGGSAAAPAAPHAYAVDAAFDATFAGSFSGSYQPAVEALAVQDDGKVLVGGRRSADPHGRPPLVRVGTDGSSDLAFAARLGSGFDGAVSSISVQDDGTILVGGSFGAVDGVPAPHLARLAADGTPDTAFSAALGSGFGGAQVTSVAVQPDGKILIGGSFIRFGDDRVGSLVRLDPDGTLDSAFTAALGTGFAGGQVETVQVQDDGRVVVGGSFRTLGGSPAPGLVRLEADGRRDTAFAQDLGSGFGAAVLSLAVQQDGKILVGGRFDEVSGRPASRVARLDADGRPDVTFTAALGGTGLLSAQTLAPQGDGSVVVGGYALTPGNAPGNGLVRLAPDGAHDTTFRPAEIYASTVLALAIEPDGSVLAGGRLTTWDWTHCLVRLSDTAPGAAGPESGQR